MTSFIEALVAEEFASEKVPGRSPRVVGLVELPLDLGGSTGIRAAGHANVVLEMLTRLDEMIARAGEGSDEQILQQLTGLAAASDDIERTLALLLVEMSDSGALRELGFASIGAWKAAWGCRGRRSRIGSARAPPSGRLRRAILHDGIGSRRRCWRQIWPRAPRRMRGRVGRAFLEQAGEGLRDEKGRCCGRWRSMGVRGAAVDVGSSVDGLAEVRTRRHGQGGAACGTCGVRERVAGAGEWQRAALALAGGAAGTISACVGVASSLSRCRCRRVRLVAACG
ncbi:MAG: hypothetical protein U0V87_10700 [Acidobacteriota bacterium]